MKQLINKRKIGEKKYMSMDSSQGFANVRFVDTKEYRTKGEEVIIVKNTQSSKIILDPTTTDHIKVKALTNVIIIPFMGKIDEEFDEIIINKGACVEFFNGNGNWYILSSDGLKQE